MLLTYRSSFVSLAKLVLHEREREREREDHVKIYCDSCPPYLAPC